MKKKQQNKVSFADFCAAAKQLNLSQSALAKTIGYTSSAVNPWRTSGEVPYVAMLAWQTLLATAQPLPSPTRLFVIKTTTPDEGAALEAFTRAMKLSFLTLEDL